MFVTVPAIAADNKVRTPRDEQGRYVMTTFAFANQGTPWEKAWLDFESRLKDCCSDEVAIKLLIRGEIGSEPVMLASLRRNRGQFGGFSMGGATSVVPELAVTLTPFLYETEAEMDFVMDEFLFEFFRKKYLEKGLVLVNWTDVGWMNIYARTPLRVPADVGRGKKMRSQSSEASQIFVESIGGDLLQLEVADIIPSLQTGLIFGGESSTVFYAFSGISGEAKEYTLTRHSYDVGVTVVNADWFAQLPGDLGKRVLASHPTSAESRNDVRKVAVSALKRLEDAGAINVHRPTPEQRELWVEQTRENAERIIRTVGGDARTVYETILAGKRAYAARQAALNGSPE